MSVSLWAYSPEKCDGNVCVGDCDLCGKADENELGSFADDLIKGMVNMAETGGRAMNDTTFQGDGEITYVPVVVNAKPPKQTNYDRIRAMTDEELAQWLDDISKACYYEGYTKETDEPQMSPYPTSPAKWVTWLKKEARDGKD